MLLTKIPKYTVSLATREAKYSWLCDKCTLTKPVLRYLLIFSGILKDSLLMKILRDYYNDFNNSQLDSLPLHLLVVVYK